MTRQAEIETERASVGQLFLAPATPRSGVERLVPLLEHSGWPLRGHRQHLEPQAPVLGTDAASDDASPWRADPPMPVGAQRPAWAGLITVAAECDDAGFDAALQADPTARLMLLHDRPEPALVQAMADGETPTTVLERWKVCARNALRVHRENRGRVTLMDVERAVAAPADFIRVCALALGDPPRRAAVEPHAALDDEVTPYHLLAAYMVMQQAEVVDLLGELEACSQPIGVARDPTPLDCRKLYQHLRDERADLQALEENIIDVRRENELLLAQLHQVQDELESTFHKLRTTSERLKQTEREAEQERARLIKTRKRSVRRMRNSLSWKITRPLRAIKGVVRPHAKSRVAKA